MHIVIIIVCDVAPLRTVLRIPYVLRYTVLVALLGFLRHGACVIQYSNSIPSYIKSAVKCANCFILLQNYHRKYSTVLDRTFLPK